MCGGGECVFNFLRSWSFSKEGVWWNLVFRNEYVALLQGSKIKVIQRQSQFVSQKDRILNFQL